MVLDQELNICTPLVPVQKRLSEEEEVNAEVNCSHLMTLANSSDPIGAYAN